MKKKLIGIFVCMLMITTSVLIFSDSKTKITSQVAEEKDLGYVVPCGITPGLMSEHLEPLDEEYFSPEPTSRSDLPEYFNWMDYEGQDWTTPSKDQGHCGSCSDFAAIGALESIIEIKEQCAALNPDLSEQYVLSCLPRSVSCFRGGWSFNIFSHIKRNDSTGNYCNGIITESYFPYKGVDPEGCTMYDCVYDPVLCDEKSENWQESLIPITNYGAWKPSATPEGRDAIKTQILESGPVVSYMMYTLWYHGKDNFCNWLWTHNNPNDYYPYFGGYEYVNHAVVLVGWKDDSSIGNGGYWIVKNSNGPDCGYNGFFNIEYGSLNIDTYQIDWVEYDPAQVSKWIPVANAGGTYQGTVGAEIAFDASGSIDHEGEVVSYAWDFGDGATGLGKTVSHKYTNKGIFPVTVTVADNDSLTSEDTTWAYIETSNVAPETPTMKGKRIGTKGTEYQLTLSANDPDGDEISYCVVWDELFAEIRYGPYPSGIPITLNYTFSHNGTYNIKVKAFDPYDAKSDWATLPIIMSYSYNPMQQFLELLFQRYPHAFPLLRQLMGY